MIYIDSIDLWICILNVDEYVYWMGENRRLNVIFNAYMDANTDSGGFLRI